MKPILIDALHIVMGGGKRLLNYLLAVLGEKEVSFVLLKDARCGALGNEKYAEEVVVMNSDEKSRKDYYRNHRDDFSLVFCFGNVPPPIKIDVKSFTYFHNVNLLKVPNDYGFKAKLMSLVKRFYIKRLAKNTDAWIVQTTYTASLLKSKLDGRRDILIYPFYDIPIDINRTAFADRTDYVFVGEHTSAKGHEYVLRAWEMMADVGFRGKLHLTVTDPEFVKKIEIAKAKGANFENHGHISFDKVVELYNRSVATVYPSLNESLGLGIVEAAEARCDVIGVELPYMLSICEPSDLFEPRDPFSLMMAVLRYDEGKNRKKTKLTIRNMANDLADFLCSNAKI